MVYPSTTYHVVPERGHWTVQEERDATTVTTCAEKESALRVGRELARSRHGALVVHRDDGSVVAEHRY
ncbi:MAG: DUF2188 domain-containing protein [Gemmatimonadetes bacterium]|nr:DUF2188 domain-containing protein [Gemmatimonadota bacterium]